jgi:hypothetical protein
VEENDVARNERFACGVSSFLAAEQSTRARLPREAHEHSCSVRARAPGQGNWKKARAIAWNLLARDGRPVVVGENVTRQRLLSLPEDHFTEHWHALHVFYEPPPHFSAVGRCLTADRSTR